MNNPLYDLLTEVTFDAKINNFLTHAREYASTNNKQNVMKWENYVSHFLSQSDCFDICIQILTIYSESEKAVAILTAQVLKSYCKKTGLEWSSLELIIDRLTGFTQDHVDQPIVLQLSISVAISLVKLALIQIKNLENLEPFFQNFFDQILLVLKAKRINTVITIQIISLIPEFLSSSILKLSLNEFGIHRRVALEKIQYAVIRSSFNLIQIINKQLVPLFTIYSEDNKRYLVYRLFNCYNSWVKFSIEAFQSFDTYIQYDWIECGLWWFQNILLHEALEQVSQLKGLSLQSENFKSADILIFGMNSMNDFLISTFELLKICYSKIDPSSMHEAFKSSMLKNILFIIKDKFCSLLSSTKDFFIIHSQNNLVHPEIYYPIMFSYVYRLSDLFVESFDHLMVPFTSSITSVEGESCFQTVNLFLFHLNSLFEVLLDLYSKACPSDVRDEEGDNVRDSFTSAMTLYSKLTLVNEWTLVSNSTLSQHQELLWKFIQTLNLITYFGEFNNQSAYSEEELENIYELRSKTRDFYREIIEKRTYLFHFFVKQTKLSINNYFNMTFQVKHQPQHWDFILNNWRESEAWLHALNAITKDSLKQLFDNHELLEEIFSLFNLLTSFEVYPCRAIARMSSILCSDILAFLHEYPAIFSSELIHLSWQRLLEKELYGILHHYEVFPTFDLKSIKPESLNLVVGQMIPFRIKQDHISAVTLYRIITLMTSTKPSWLIHLINEWNLTDSLRHYNEVTHALAHDLHHARTFKGSLYDSSLSHKLLYDLIHNYYLNILTFQHNPRILSWKSFCIVYNGMIDLFWFHTTNILSDVDPNHSLLFIFLTPSILSSVQKLINSFNYQQYHIENLLYSLSKELLTPGLESEFGSLISLMTSHCPLQLTLSIGVEFLRCVNKLFAPNISSNSQETFLLLLFSILLNFLKLLNHRSDVDQINNQENDDNWILLNHCSDIELSLINQYYDYTCKLLIQIILSNKFSNPNFIHKYMEIASELSEGHKLFIWYCSHFRSFNSLSSCSSFIRLLLHLKSYLANNFVPILNDSFKSYSEIGLEISLNHMQRAISSPESLRMSNVFIFGVEQDSKKNLIQMKELNSLQSLYDLLLFWIETLELTTLYTIISGPKNSVSQNRLTDPLPWSYLGWNTLASIIQCIHDCFSYHQIANYKLCLPTLNFQIGFCCVKLLDLLFGPLNISLDKMTIKSSKESISQILVDNKAKASPQGMGDPQLCQLWLSTDWGSKIMICLLKALRGSIVSSLHNDCIQLIIKLFFILGYDNASRFILRGIKSIVKGSSTEETNEDLRLNEVATTMHDAASNGDWKKFKAGLKVMIACKEI